MSELKIDSHLQDAASWMSSDLLTHCVSGYYECSHTDSTGRDPGKRLQDFGYPVSDTAWGEIIAWGYYGGMSSALDALNAWKGSPGHNSVMLYGGFAAAGISRSCNSNLDCAWVVNFGGRVTSPPSSFDYSVSVNPSSGSVEAGNKVTTKADLVLISGTAANVSLSCTGLPSGATCSFSPAAVTPTSASTLTISTQSSTPVGNYTVMIVGTAGSITRSASYRLTVSAPPQSQDLDFSLSANPLSAKGMFGMTTISAKLISGSPTSVKFSCTGLPKGASCIFIPNSCKLNCSSRLMVFAFSTPAGTYRIGVNATAGTVTKTTEFTLTR